MALIDGGVHAHQNAHQTYALIPRDAEQSLICDEPN